MSSPWTVSARWIFPADRPPLAHGTVTIDGARITAVEPAGVRSADLDYGNAALLPGLVNAHTHLDLSGLRGRCQPSADFTGWLREVVRHRRTQTVEQVRTDIEIGLAEALRFGTTLLGDISSRGQSWPVLVQAPVRAVVFHELLGLTTERARAAWDDMQEWLPWRAETAACRVGLSPHAPYSVRKSLFEQTAAYTRGTASDTGHRLPVAIHIAESQAELELLAHRRGPFVDFLKELGVWDPDGLATSPEEVTDCFRDLPRVLWIHANFLPPFATPPGSTIIYCPRTHAAFGHPPHPFRNFMKQGVRVALGTDSLASNPDLDMLAEVRFVHRRYPDVPGPELLRTVTLNGAEALGFGDETGSLTPGKSADFIVVPLPNRETADPHELVFAADSALEKVVYRGH